MAIDPKVPPNLSQLIDLARAENPAVRKNARDELAAALYDRTTRMVAAMLRGFPVVQQHNTVSCITQDLWCKLLLALDAGVESKSTGEFLRIAANRLWRLLVDEANKYRGRVKSTKKHYPHGARSSARGGSP